MSDLSAAHYGYNHQDVITAYALATLLLPRATDHTVTVDKKVMPADCFDDLELLGHRRGRSQIKSHENASRLLQLTDFTQNTISFRIDRAISSVTGDPNPADEYRLVTTCVAAEDKLLSFLQPTIPVPSLLPELPTQRFRLSYEKIWPEGGAPLWPHVEGFGREALVTFCSRFVIELGCPRSTGDLRSPGPLERSLYRILHDHIGVGIWPNHNQDLSDAAAHLLHAAKIARQNSSSVEQQDVIRVLKLVTDYGRVTERFPIDDRRLVPRSDELDNLVSKLLTNPRLVVTGPPGFGKSWLLNQLASRLTAEGWVVAVHYCFIDVLDQERSRRASVETTFGSIMAELYDSDPSVATSSVPRYAAGPQELERLLGEAVREKPERRIAIIVDGLDHADRVPDRSNYQMATEICEELNALSLPPGVVLIIGSQPGTHLESFAAAGEFCLNKWPAVAIRLLAERLDVPGALKQGGLAGDTDRVLEVIVQKAQGSPLYASYLARTAIALMRPETSTTSVSDIPEYLGNIPNFDENLDRYYAWLVTGFEGDHGALWIAELLSLLEFPVSVDELGEIRPAFRHHIPAVVARLAPVLTEDLRRGRVRIHHESFQRYMQGQLERDGAASIQAVLAPVIEWLDARGFFADLRAFRFLLALLKRAGRGGEGIVRINVDFVAQAATHCQPADAVLANIAMAGTLAATSQDWAALARLNEISRAAEYLYHWRLTGDHRLAEEFGRAYAARFGAHALAERLLHDGRCTFAPRSGLVLCKLCDEQGAIPPWMEYRLAYDRERQRSNTSYGREEDAALAIARAQGRFRLDGREASIIRCTKWLDASDSLPFHPLDAAMILGQMYGTDALSTTVEAVHPGKGRAWARLALALLLPDASEAKVQATAAIQDSLPEENWHTCLRAGADPLLFTKDSARLHDLTVKVISPGIEHRPEQLNQWLTGLELTSILGDENGLLSIQAGLPSNTWYRRWLSFCVTLVRPSVTQVELVTVLQDLSKNIEIFVGSPRVCDLYGLHKYLRESFKDVLDHLDDAYWPDALDALLRLSQGTTAWLDSSRSGPITLNVLLDVCIESANTTAKRQAVSAMCEKLFAPGEQTHELYDIHAEDQFLLTRIYTRTDQNESAAKTWVTGCTYLSAYGYRKDVTVYELLNPLKALASVDSMRVRHCFKDVQPIVERILSHTDGRETGHALHTWIDDSAQAHPAGALSYFARETISRSPSLGGLDHAIPKALVSIKDLAPTQLAAGWLAVGSQARSDAQSALVAVERVRVIDHQLAQSLWDILIAILDGDGVGSAQGLAELAAESAVRFGFPAHSIRAEAEKKSTDTERGIVRRNFFLDVPALIPATATNFQIVHYMRGWHQGDETRPDTKSLIAAIGWRLIESIETGNEKSAESILRRIAYDMSPWYGQIILAGLAEGLALRGYNKLAALASTFAYTRGNDGWHPFAGPKGEHLFLKAIALDAPIAWSTLSTEVGESVARGGSYGVTGHLIELLAAGNRVDDAFAAWDEACRAIIFRVPSTGPQDEIDPLYDPSANDSMDMLAMAVVARINHCLLHEKRYAIAATALLASRHPVSLVAAVRLAMKSGAPPSTLITLLHILERFEPPPYDATRMSSEEIGMIAAGELVSARILARQLLERAGLPVPPSPVISVPLGSAVSDRRTRDIIRSIGIKHVNAIEEVWPAFGQHVAGRIDAVIQSEKIRKRTQSVIRSIGDRRQQHRLRVWLPMDEEVGRAVQMTGAAVRIALAKEGIINEAAEAKVGRQLLGDLEVIIRRTYSRTARPTYMPTPTSLTPGSYTSTPRTVPTGQFASWVILAHHETELEIEDRYPNEIRKELTVYSGIEFGGVGDPTGLPLTVGDPTMWRAIIPKGTLSESFRGPIAGVDFVGDLYGAVDILSLNPVLGNKHLVPAPFYRGLSLIDSNGELACVCRSWRQKYVGDRELGDEIPCLEGIQLLLRSDVFETISAVALRPVTYMTVVTNAISKDGDSYED